MMIAGIMLHIKRCHDRGKSGWWCLIFLVPLLNIILLLLWFTQRGTEGANEYGADPLTGA